MIFFSIFQTNNLKASVSTWKKKKFFETLKKLICVYAK